jgi:hypothetical protein
VPNLGRCVVSIETIYQKLWCIFTHEEVAMYQDDEKAREAKQTELVLIAQDAMARMGTNNPQLARAVVEAFAKITAPKEPSPFADFTTLYVGERPRGESRKPGNIILNWHKLIEFVPDATLAAAAAKDMTWLIPFAALYIWLKLWRAAKEDLTDVEATVIFAFWKYKDATNKIPLDAGFEKTKTARAELKLPAISRETYEKAVNRLLDLDCIDLKDGSVRLRELVKVSYS